MPPKKRDKDMEAAKNPRIDHIQADHELFLQAFEKPTQIYRYLRTRNMCSPIFLNRTLTYMRYRMSRQHKQRQTFKIDSLLDKVISKQNHTANAIQPGYINITFLGFSDKNLIDYAVGNTATAHVEIMLLKISHKKRKESSAPSMQMSLGSAEISVNSSSDDTNNGDFKLPQTAPTISIPTESFNCQAGALVKSYIFVFRVEILTDNSGAGNNNSTDEDEPPAQKRRKSNIDCASSATALHSVTTTKVYGAELTVYDKHNRCYLQDGDYDVYLQDYTSLTKTSPKKHSSWENGSDIMENACGNVNVTMKSGAILKFKLNWSLESCARIVERPKLYPLLNDNNNKENIPACATSSALGTQIQQSIGDSLLEKKEKLQIVYQFVYNNNSRQQTEACEDLHCPWCSINSDQLYTLLKHLKLCHSRFTFTYVPISIGARIDVAINELYDGSYTGSPHDLISQPTVCAFSRNGPVRRASVTHILVCHPKRVKASLSEFLELDDCEYDGQRPFITGHNRLYHHTTTCLPIYPKEMDVDSEGENDPEWLRNKTMMWIDEFTDVNEGEKELMKMWNLHVMKYGFVGDCQIPLACQMFVQHKGKELLMKNLYKNFVLHMGSLFDFGLVSAVCLYTTIQKLQEMVGETAAIRNVLKESRDAQIDNWSKIKHSMKQEQTSEKATPGGSSNSKSLPTNHSGRKTNAVVGVQRRKTGGGGGGGNTPAAPSAVDNVPTLMSRRKSMSDARKRLSLNGNNNSSSSSSKVASSDQKINNSSS